MERGSDQALGLNFRLQSRNVFLVCSGEARNFQYWKEKKCYRRQKRNKKSVKLFISLCKHITGMTRIVESIELKTLFSAFNIDKSHVVCVCDVFFYY